MESHASSKNIFNAYINKSNNSPIRLDGNLLPNSTIDHELDDMEDVILDDSPLISNRRRDESEQLYKQNLRSKLLNSSKFSNNNGGGLRSSSQTLIRDNTPSMSDLREKSPLKQKLEHNKAILQKMSVPSSGPKNCTLKIPKNFKNLQNKLEFTKFLQNIENC